jgi:NAD-dependent deacetylase
MIDDAIQRIAKLIHDARRIVVFTGAGISTESGIPDFRSPGGIWSRYNQDDLTYQKFRSGEQYRKLYWKYDQERYPAMRDAQPNAAHRAVAEMEHSGRLLALITQNIDGLHETAGSSRDKTYELHGTVREVTCLDCHRRWPREEITEMMARDGVAVPYCPDCNGPLKCATIAFGQALPVDVLEDAFHHARHCDLFLTIGSSLVVQPANLLPLEARRCGATLILINLGPTPYDEIMEYVVRGPAGATMEAIMSEFRKLGS